MAGQRPRPTEEEVDVTRAVLLGTAFLFILGTMNRLFRIRLLFLITTSVFDPGGTGDIPDAVVIGAQMGFTF